VQPRPQASVSGISKFAENCAKDFKSLSSLGVDFLSHEKTNKAEHATSAIFLKDIWPPSMGVCLAKASEEFHLFKKQLSLRILM
jgi:hypothetical protein